MMNVKVKSVFKIVCVLSAVVIFCYLGKKFGLFEEKLEESEMAGRRILSSEFEVFGLVQGVFFRKNTEDTAKRLGLRGWCMNTKEGTVKGLIEGEEKHFNEMKHWLTNTGSPQSRIDKTVFSEVKHLDDYTFPKFEVRRFKKN